MSAEPVAAISINERLGYPREAKLLIVNADDAGMCHAVNAGVERALRMGLVTSCTVMAPCPWFGDFAARVRRCPDLRAGIHLTTTSEWDNYRWGPVAPRERVRSLLDPEGFFYRSEGEFYQKADLGEVEIEFRAQIEKCFSAGLRPTHLDSHMGIYHFQDGTFALAQRLADEYRLTLRDGYPPRLKELQAAGFGVVDYLYFETHDIPLEKRREMYLQFFDQQLPGLTELVIHPAEPTEELRAIGGMWQRRGFDLEFFTNPETRDLLADKNVTLIGYDRLKALTAQLRKW